MWCYSVLNLRSGASILRPSCDSVHSTIETIDTTQELTKSVRGRDERLL